MSYARSIAARRRLIQPRRKAFRQKWWFDQMKSSGRVEATANGVAVVDASGAKERKDDGR